MQASFESDDDRWQTENCGEFGWSARFWTSLRLTPRELHLAITVPRSSGSFVQACSGEAVCDTPAKFNSHGKQNVALSNICLAARRWEFSCWEGHDSRKSLHVSILLASSF